MVNIIKVTNTDLWEIREDSRLMYSGLVDTHFVTYDPKTKIIKIQNYKDVSKSYSFLSSDLFLGKGLNNAIYSIGTKIFKNLTTDLPIITKSDLFYEVSNSFFMTDGYRITLLSVKNTFDHKIKSIFGKEIYELKNELFSFNVIEGILVNNVIKNQIIKIYGLSDEINGILPKPILESIASDQTSPILDLKANTYFKFTLDANMTIDYINGFLDKNEIYFFEFIQDATAGRLLTFAADKFDVDGITNVSVDLLAGDITLYKMIWNGLKLVILNKYTGFINV